MKTYQFVVTLRLKQGNKITQKEAGQYVSEAVKSWKGCYHPESNEFDLDANQFSVRSLSTKERQAHAPQERNKQKDGQEEHS